jgi:hypothetical protein
MVYKGQEEGGKLGNLYFIATKDTKNNTLIVKFANVDSNDIGSGVDLNDSVGSGVDPSTLQNTLINPNAASIITSSIFVINRTCSITVSSRSIIVVTISL